MKHLLFLLFTLGINVAAFATNPNIHWLKITNGVVAFLLLLAVISRISWMCVDRKTRREQLKAAEEWRLRQRRDSWAKAIASLELDIYNETFFHDREYLS